jgi:hypothetical protein
MAFKGMGLSVIKKSPLCFWQKTFKFSFNKGRYTVYKGQSCKKKGYWQIPCKKIPARLFHPNNFQFAFYCCKARRV